jgi:hypothetical protein
MASYIELLNAVDKLLAFSQGLKPIGGKYTPELQSQGRTPNQISEVDESTLIALDHLVRELAVSCVLIEYLPRPEWDERQQREERCLSTGLLLDYPWNEKRVSRWRSRMMPFRLIVKELVGSTTEAKTQPVGENGSDRTNAILAAVTDDITPKIIQVAGDKSLSSDDKLRLIVRLDSRFKAKTSGELGVLLEVTSSAIRDTEWWKVDRHKETCE